MAESEGPASALSESFSKIKRGGTSCAAVNCHNRRNKNPGLSFFRFPGPKSNQEIER